MRYLIVALFTLTLALFVSWELGRILGIPSPEYVEWEGRP